MNPILQTVVIFLVAVILSWYPGNQLIWGFWKIVAALHKIPIRHRNILVQKIGGLERTLYIYAGMFSHYELVTAWLIMKGFFGWIERTRERGTIVPREERDLLGRYNSYLFGNICSVLIGLGTGLVAKFVVDTGVISNIVACI